MMSNSNYSMGLLRLKPVHTAYCGLHNLAENWSWAQDINGRDWDETETSASRDRDETETLTIFLQTKPRRDVGTSRDRDVETETTILVTTDKW